ncbi:MAG: thioredoxin-disulfide reductase [Actinomycetota bacterium]
MSIVLALSTNPQEEGCSVDSRDVIIIGSGPAGYTAAIYAARANLVPLIFEGSVSFGGALMNTTEVENFPGFPEGIQGPDLMGSMRDQAARFGAELVTDDVVKVNLKPSEKEVWTGSGDKYTARSVIVATGSAYRKLHVDGEERLSGRGVSWCATCDGFFFRNQDIAVVGGGDSAMEEALFLTKFARKVTVLHRRDHLRASKVMSDRAFANEKITFRWSTAVEKIHGEKSLDGLTLRDLQTGGLSQLDVTGLFIAIGHDPRTELFQDQLKLEEHGHIYVDGRSSQTSEKGVFACGDVIDSDYMQAITAAASGCVAALDVERYLESIE